MPPFCRSCNSPDVCAVNLDVGVAKTASARDRISFGKPLADLLNDTSGRLFRAFNNHFEGLILFTIAVVIITLGDQSTNVTTTALGSIFSRASLMSPPITLAGHRGVRSSGLQALAQPSSCYWRH